MKLCFSDTPRQKQRGRKRLKTRFSRQTETFKTDLSPSEEPLNDIRQSKEEEGDSNQLLSTIPNPATDATCSEKVTTNLPPARAASLSSISSGCSNSKRKAVAIVRPQPQQLKQDPLVDSRKLESGNTTADLQVQLDDNKSEPALNERLIAKNETKLGKELKKSFSRSKIKALSPKDPLRKVQTEREARFSLYDFPSDSENETDTSPASLSPLGGINGKANNNSNVGLEDKSLSPIKSSNTELKAAGNNNSSIDFLLSTQHRKLSKSSPSPPLPIKSSRLKSKGTTAPEVDTEHPISKVISTLSSSNGCPSFSKLPITTIARSSPTTSSTSSPRNNNKSFRPPDLCGKQLSDPAGSDSNVGNVSGPSVSLAVHQGKHATQRKSQQTTNTLSTKLSSTVNSSALSSTSNSITSAESLRMQADTNTVSASSNYPHAHQPHQQTDHHQSSSSYANLRDDRSDSGLSTLRSDGARSSGDERSGSRSSAVSDEILLRAAGGGSGVPPSTSHTGRPNSANAADHTRLPAHTPPSSVNSLNSPFGISTPSSRALHPSSSGPSHNWREISAFNKLLPGQPQSNITRAAKLQALPPMSSDARPPPPSAVSRGGTSGVPHHLPSSVPGSSAVGLPPSVTSSSTTSQQQAAVVAAMSAAHQQQWASVAAAHQYQAALQAASLAASQNPAQIAQQALIAQYQSLAAASAAGITPDVLKQFPHLASGLPHPLLSGRGAAGAGSAAAAHHDILLARERELAERERAIR